MRREIQKYIRFLCDCLFPITCSVCQRDGYVVCPECLDLIPLFDLKTANQTLDVGDFLDQVFVCASYDDKAVQHLIKAAKYHGSKESARFLGRLTCHWVHEYGAEVLKKCTYIVPIPLHPRRRRQRGYNQCDLIAEVLGKCSDRLVRYDIIQRKRYTAQQARLSRQERLQNITDAFWVTEEVKGAIIVLVDDVATTGATLDNAAKALKKAGARQVFALVVAKH